ncbi:MAG: hypothetical protein ACI83P_001369 [Janthinobacterium sp.]|jgi:hypothetical protein
MLIMPCIVLWLLSQGLHGQVQQIRRNLADAPLFLGTFVGFTLCEI